MTLTLTHHLSTCTAIYEIHLHAMHKVSMCNSCLFWPIKLTFDLLWWPWPWPPTTQLLQLYEIHVHAKYEGSFSTCTGPGPKLKSFDFSCMYIWPLTLTHSILATTIVVGKNMLWMPSADYSRRAFRYIRSSIFYTFPVFDHFIGHTLYPVNW